MAYLVRRGDRRIEIRESVSTPRGPRSRVLVSFTGPLTPDVLDRAAARAHRRFDAAALRRRARATGVPVVDVRQEPEARALLARLRRRDPLDPVLAAALRRALSQVPEAPISDDLVEVTEWIGAGAAERGAALRDLLDLASRIETARPRPRTRERARFPRFSSRRRAG